MNIEKLKQAEAGFLDRYPGGFENPEMVAIAKKHKMDQMVAYTQESFQKENFRMPDLIVDRMVKVASRSSMVSVFEKPKFRDYAYALAPDRKRRLTDGLFSVCYGNEQQGFEAMVEVLVEGKLAKWTLMTVCQAYFRPNFEIFIKPTTAKGVIQTYELQNLQYKPKPSWAFYNQYRQAINQMKSLLDPALSPSNAAFSGFLMMSMEG